MLRFCAPCVLLPVPVYPLAAAPHPRLSFALPTPISDP